MTDLTTITVVLLLAILGGETARYFRYPRIIGQLLVSLFCTVPVLNGYLTSPAATDIIQTMSGFGVVLLLFLTGFDLDIAEAKRSSRNAVSIAIGAALIPFAMGFSLALWLGFSVSTALVLGACLSLTAEGTSVALLLELKKLRTKVGSTLLAAGIIDDLFEVLFLALVLILSHQESGEPLWLFPLKIALFAGVIGVASRVLPPVTHRLEKNDANGLLTIMLVVALLFAVGSELVGLGSILGAFIGGMLMQKSFLSINDKNGEDHMLQVIAFSLVIPFFFIQIGLNFSFNALLESPLITLSVLLAAMVGKIGGTLLTKPVSTLSWRQLLLVGWGMNSRGVMELVIAQIAYNAGLISQELYSAIIFMAIVTTVVFPFVMQHMLKRTPGLMEA